MTPRRMLWRVRSAIGRPTVSMPGRVIEQLRIAAVPRHHAQFGIDHADALAHVFQCRFQHALIEAQILRGLADDGRDRVQLVTPSVTHDVQQQMRRRRTDYRGKFVLHGGDLLCFAS